MGELAYTSGTARKFARVNYVGNFQIYHPPQQPVQRVVGRRRVKRGGWE